MEVAMGDKLSWLMAALVLLHCVSSAAADSIQGCGGFVEASTALSKLRRPSDPKLDYSHMTVELRTLDGLIKDSTQCAPNGYYYLPVYDRGTFVIKIKGLEGWSFEPEQVTAVVDHNGCNNNDDINFRYTGFSLSGKVLGAAGGASCSGTEGPAGIKVTVVPEGGSSGESMTVVTSPGGSYKFSNLPAGKYKLSASHPKWNVQVNGVPEAELNWNNGVVDDIFFIAGYDIDGSVVSQGNPVLGVEVYLYSDDVQEIPCPNGPGDSNVMPKKALCHAVSGVDGKFTFSSVPCGHYQLIPFYKGDTTVFDISPPSVDIHVTHDSVEIAKPFQVTGFSVRGRVVDSQGAGIGGVKIVIEDVERATTDAQGYYKLDQVTSTHHTVKAKKPYYKFSTLDNFMVLPNMASVPDIKATHYAVCGSVSVLSAAHTGVRQVALTHGPANVKPQTKRSDERGSFCFEVPPGDYRLSPLITPTETVAGLIFSPPYLDITVYGPVTDALFVQAQVSVSGIVKCKGTCSSHVVVSLSPVSTTPSAKADSSKKQIARVGEDGESFSFEKVLPGKYHLEIAHEPLTQGASWDDEWCWEQKSLSVDVGIEDISGLTFVQKGYWLHIQSTHAASAYFLHEQKDAMPLQIKKGWQKVCLESPGIHELQFLWPCVFFGALSFRVDTAIPEPLHLVGEKYVLTGHLNIDSKLYPEANNLANSMSVDVWHEDGDQVAQKVHMHLVAESNETHPVAVYKYAHWAQLGDKLVFAPRHGEQDSDAELSDGKKILFYPRDQKFHVETDGCQPEIPVFNGRPGVYKSGTVTPPIAGVNVTILAVGDSSLGRLKAGELAAWTLTGEDGTFSAGPLYDDTSYDVQAAKAGYYLKSMGENTFSCQKLGQIVVNILPGEGAEENFPAVLLSLSGDDGYRKNAATESGGSLTFGNLFPGSFYLRPLLKEYSFSPAAQAIEVSSGEFKEVSFSARRIAYSVLGTVTFLSGKPAEGVSLEARSERGYYEVTVTDAEGKYRLRGLLPKTSYGIKTIVKDDNPSKIERASPATAVVKVNDNDTFGVDFVVFEETPTTIVTGAVEGENLDKWQPHIMIEFSKASEPFSVVQSVPLPLSYFFEVQGLPSGTYNVRLAFGLSERTHNFDSSVLELDLVTKNHFHLGSLTFKAEENLHSQELTLAPVVPIVVGVAVIAMFASMPRLKDGYQWIVGTSGPSTSVPGPKKEVRRTTVRTKRAL
ncbi:BOS complex subunit NOMO [Marchantia polymorpha subsp. ruderalis]|uniref:Uncharacterized protein n=2 Tax=Marchantia polymorpha TaxID=3197 RepID=A0AAF6AU74_MARPO|nr:hypothetical protein MARPO_0002s0320 [Marchantia polymorpha]BBM99994.1 hypothetical protein Mp_1g25520 [Marchantia polymorpha subsp. ruderalis]|eukprot:PTQ49885.1 hypothetical protein MARPO_0002s0320 [Marchantia polymorpha]